MKKIMKKAMVMLLAFMAMIVISDVNVEASCDKSLEYQVHYIDVETNMKIIDSKTAYGTYKANIYETPKEIDGYVYLYDINNGFKLDKKADRNIYFYYEKFEKTTLNVKKVWEDEGDIRPDSVTVYLSANYVLTGESVVLSEDNNWSYSWDNLDKFDENGNEIEYFVIEEDVEGYVSSLVEETEITQVEKQKSNVYVKTENLVDGKPYLIAKGYSKYGAAQLLYPYNCHAKYQDINVVNQNIEIDGVTYSQYIEEDSITDAFIWFAEDSGDNGFYYFRSLLQEDNKYNYTHLKACGSCFYTYDKDKKNDAYFKFTADGQNKYQMDKCISKVNLDYYEKVTVSELVDYTTKTITITNTQEKEETYKVYYDAGIGSGLVPEDVNDYFENDNVTLINGRSPEILDGIFVGWSFEKHPMLESVDDLPSDFITTNQTFAMPGHDVTLYAVYIEEFGTF